MKLNNYYQTLTEKQKEKIKEKVATSMFYNWYDELREDFSLEEAGAILLAILFYDRTHGEEEIPADLMEVINRDRATKHIFLEYTNKTAACTRNWLNIHGKRKQKEEDTSTESPLKCPTMPQSIKEGHDTTPPPKSDFRAEEDEEKEEIKNYVVATGKYQRDGLSIQEIYEQDPEWIEEMAKNRNPQNALAKEDIEFIRKYVEVILNKPIEDTTSTESPLQCPTMPQDTEEGHDTTPPPKSDLRAENEVIETYGCVMDINEEDGVLFIDEGGTYTFNPDENPNITDFIEKFVVISHNSKNEIINIEEDTPF